VLPIDSVRVIVQEEMRRFTVNNRETRFRDADAKEVEWPHFGPIRFCHMMETFSVALCSRHVAVPCQCHRVL
jgi:hypothetical protein